MTNESRNLGTQFETGCIRFLRGIPLRAERLPRTGANDEGDIALTLPDGRLYIIECKARRDRMSTQNFGAWLREAHTEAANYTTARSLEEPAKGILVVKRPQKSIAQSFVIQTLEAWIDDHNKPGSSGG